MSVVAYSCVRIDAWRSGVKEIKDVRAFCVKLPPPRGRREIYYRVSVGYVFQGTEIPEDCFIPRAST